MPDLFTNEGVLTPDELKRLIDPDLVPESERFEFRCFGKADAKRNAFTPTLRIFGVRSGALCESRAC